MTAKDILVPNLIISLNALDINSRSSSVNNDLAGHLFRYSGVLVSFNGIALASSLNLGLSIGGQFKSSSSLRSSTV